MKTALRFALAMALTSITIGGSAAPAPSFSLKASDGKVYTLKSLTAGRPVFVMFYSAGCEHNPAGIRDLNLLKRVFGEKVRVAGMVNLDVHQTIAFAKQYRAQFPILSDQMANTIGKLGGKGGLDNALILANGEIAHVWTGYDQSTLRQVDILIKSLYHVELKLNLSPFPKDRQAGCAISMNM